MTGNRQLHMAMYIPHIYSRTQKEWVDNFWKQNGYLGKLKVDDLYTFSFQEKEKKISV